MRQRMPPPHHPTPDPAPPHTLPLAHHSQPNMCPGPLDASVAASQQQLLGKAATEDAATAPAAGREGNGKEEGVYDFFRSYTDEPHRSRYVRVYACAHVFVCMSWGGEGLVWGLFFWHLTKP